MTDFLTGFLGSEPEEEDFLSGLLGDDDVEPERQGFWREVLGAGASAAAGLGTTLGRLQEAAGPVGRQWLGRPPTERESEWLLRTQEATAPSDQRPFLERASDDPLRAIARAGATAVPSLAPMAVGALAGPAGLAAGVAVGAGLGGGSMGLDVYDEAIERGASEEKALALGVGVGSLGALLDGLGARGLAKPVTTGLLGQAVQAARKGSTQKLAKQILAGTATEVATEEAQELISMVGEYAAGTPLEELLEMAPDRLAEAAVGAALVSGGVGGVSAAGQAGQRRRHERQQRQLSGEEARRQSELFGQVLEQVDALDADAKAALVADAAATSDFYQARVAIYGRELGEFESLTIPDEDLARIDEFVEKADKLGVWAHQKARHVGAETLWVDKAKQLFGKKSQAARGLEIAFSLGRVGRVKAQAISHNPIVNLRGQVVARSMVDILAPVYAAKPALETDPNPEFLKRFISENQWSEGQKLWRDSPLARHLEETRWVLRQEELAQRAAEDPEALVKPARKLTEEARQRHIYLKTLPEYDLLKETAEELSSWDQHVITLGEAAGVLSSEAAEHILASGKHYAGFYEALNEGGKIAVKFARANAFDPQEFFQPVTKGLRADQKLALPTVASLQRAQALHQLAGYQYGRQNVVRMVRSVPEAFAAEGIVVDEHLEPEEAKARGLVPTELSVGGQKRKIFAPPELAAAAEEGDLHLKTFQVFVDGEKQTLFAPEPFADALDAMPAPSRHAVRKLFAFFTSMRRSTSILTPRFTATTLFRDQPEAAAIAATHGVTYRPWVDAIQAFGQLAQEFIGPGNPQARQFLAQGGGLASIASTEMAESLGNLKDVALRVHQDHAPNTIAAMKYMLRRAGRAYGREISQAREGDWTHMGSALLSPIAHLTEVVDKSTRLGLFNASLRSGKTIQEAMDVSRRGAIDFSRKGEDAQRLGDFYPFYNPQVQSFDLNTEAATRGGLGVGLAVAGLVVLPELLHFALRHDDEEYQARPEWEKKRNYFWFKTPEGNEWITTPRPLGWLSAVFGFALGQALEQSYRDDPRVVGRVLGALQDEIPLVSQFGAVAGAGFDDEGEWDPKSRIMEALPEAVVLPFELTMNQKAFFATPVVPAWMEHRHPKERAYRNTPEVYRDIARYLPEKVSPLQVEHVARTASGSLGAGIVRFQDAVAREGDFALDDIPVVTAFIARRRDAPSLAPVQRLFELVKEQKYYRSYKPTTQEEALRVTDYKRMEAALKVIRGLIEDRNTYDQLMQFDLRDRLDELIIELGTDALRGVGERGTPGEGFAPGAGEAAQEARRILGHVFGGGP